MPTTLPELAPFLGEDRAPDLGTVFDRVVVLNLARRSERMARFRARLQMDWPFPAPERFEAIDGVTLMRPPQWKLSPGAWGCQKSHLAVLKSALADGVESLLVLEDDAYPVPDLTRQAESFFRHVPDDWHCLMLGAEHLLPPISLGHGVVRCVASIRCHAYALRGPLMQMLATFWEANRTDHCDLVLSSLMTHYKTYAPAPQLFGQDAGMSDTELKQRPLCFFHKH